MKKSIGILTFGLLFLLMTSVYQNAEYDYDELHFQNIVMYSVYFHCRFKKQRIMRTGESYIHICKINPLKSEQTQEKFLPLKKNV